MSADIQKSYQQSAEEALSEFSTEARKHLAETGQPLSIYESGVAIAAMTGAISIKQWNQLEEEGLVKIVYDPKP